MENYLDAWAQELREAGCCLSGFTLKFKALEILRKLGQFDGKFLATDGWLRDFFHRKNYTLRRITTTGRDLPNDFLIKLPIHILVNRATELPNYEHPDNSYAFLFLILNLIS